MSTPPPSINFDLAKALDLIQTACKTPFKDVDANIDKLTQAEQLLKKASDELRINGVDSE